MLLSDFQFGFIWIQSCEATPTEVGCTLLVSSWWRLRVDAARGRLATTATTVGTAEGCLTHRALGAPVVLAAFATAVSDAEPRLALCALGTPVGLAALAATVGAAE